MATCNWMKCHFCTSCPQTKPGGVSGWITPVTTFLEQNGAPSHPWNTQRLQLVWVQCRQGEQSGGRHHVVLVKWGYLLPCPLPCARHITHISRGTAVVLNFTPFLLIAREHWWWPISVIFLTPWKTMCEGVHREGMRVNLQNQCQHILYCCLSVVGLADDMEEGMSLFYVSERVDLF